MYADQVARYKALFPSRQIGIWLYEETRVPGFLADVYDFLGVDDSFMPDMSTRYLEQQVPRIAGMGKILKAPALRALVPLRVRQLLRRVVYRPRGVVKMSARERGILTEYYRPDILRLETVLQRDLSHWVAAVGG